MLVYVSQYDHGPLDFSATQVLAVTMRTPIGSGIEALAGLAFSLEKG
jgi:hypothetical protein